MQGLVLILLAYLLGGVMGGDLIGRLRGGTDLRRTGSGNVGATNALRAQGPRFALAVLLVDIGKGVVAAILLPRLPWPHAAGISVINMGFVCGLASVVGHCYPLFARFRGGKGVATALGISVALTPWALPWILGVFALTLVLTGYVALASLLASATAVLWLVFRNPSAPLAADLAMTSIFLLMVYRHRQNLIRMRQGTEHRFERARQLGRWLRIP